jgi:hypothetical protein
LDIRVLAIEETKRHNGPIKILAQNINYSANQNKQRP